MPKPPKLKKLILIAETDAPFSDPNGVVRFELSIGDRLAAAPRAERVKLLRNGLRRMLAEVFGDDVAGQLIQDVPLSPVEAAAVKVLGAQLYNPAKREGFSIN
jgi:hypothetical protein